MMKLYDVDGHDRPLLLDEQHAQRIGAVEHAELTQPARNGSRDAWVEYAVALGADPYDVDSYTRTELIEQYGT